MFKGCEKSCETQESIKFHIHVKFPDPVKKQVNQNLDHKELMTLNFDFH